MMNTNRHMKILYQIHSTYNPGGMERVLLNKVRYLVEEKGWDVAVVTTVVLSVSGCGGDD